MSTEAEQIVITLNHDGAKKEVFVFDSAFATLANEVIDPAEGMDLKISRDQNLLRIRGTLKGEEESSGGSSSQPLFGVVYGLGQALGGEKEKKQEVKEEDAQDANHRFFFIVHDLSGPAGLLV